MSKQIDLDRMVAALLTETAARREPAGLLDSVLSTTGRSRPRPRWLAFIKEPPMRTNSRLAVGSPTFRLASIMALTLALILAAAAAVVAGASMLPSPARNVPAPFGPAANGSLIYEKAGDIWVADADGSNAKAIITGPTWTITQATRTMAPRSAGDAARTVTLASGSPTPMAATLTRS